ncbi:MAG: Na+/melibiose symporter-like transporter [Planctomycetota bacterium]|jgi:Na+/melibiose symporter-like transporter
MKPTSKPLPWSVQVGYAMADVGINAVETALRLYLLIYYTDRIGLRADLAGLALALGLLWDAVTDPVMGAISDRTAHGRHGRRIYVLIGGVLLAFAVVLLFHPPELAGQWQRFGWLLGAFCFLNTALTIINVPHMAMAGEMTVDPHERSVLFGWRFACMNFGAVFAAALPAVLLSGPEERTVSAMGPFSLLVALVVVASAAWTWRATKRIAFHVEPSRKRSLFAEFKEAFGNPTFRPLVLVYVIATIGVGVNSAVALYYYNYQLELSDRQIQIMVAVLMVVFTISIVFWVRFSQRKGKNRPIVLGASLLGISTSVLYLLLPPGNFVLPLVLGAVGLGSLIGCIVLIDSLLTDVIDHDCITTGVRRSGVFFGVWRFASKLARAAAIGGTGLVLNLIGFVPNEVQSEGVRRALSLLFGPGVGLFFLAAAVLLSRYRFTDSKQRQVQRILVRRRVAAEQN